MCNISNDSRWKDVVVMVALELIEATTIKKHLWNLASARVNKETPMKSNSYNNNKKIARASSYYCYTS